MKPPRPSSLIALALVSALCPTPGRGHESPIDHVERELRLFAEDGQVLLTYRLLPTERAALDKSIAAVKELVATMNRLTASA